MARVVIPPELEQALREDKHLREVFDNLPPGRQTEYVKFIENAKKPERRAKRVLRTIQMIDEYVKSVKTSGQSGTPLVKKLGLKEGMNIRLINEPDNYFDLVDHIKVDTIGNALSQVDAVHLFVDNMTELEEELPKLREQIVADGMIWVSWPKGSKKINENRIRDHVLDLGLVDVKTCSIDNTWSGLKLIVSK